MDGRIEDYKYSECGLKSVVLKGILVFKCKQCSSIVAEITAAESLHRVIALRLLSKDALLSGDEVRFLRKVVGYSATELAKLAGTSKNVVSRWETKSTLGKDSDRLIRLICMNRIMRDALVEVDPRCLGEIGVNEDLKRATHLPAVMEDTLRKLRNKRVSKSYVIPPSELKDLGGGIENPPDTSVQ